MRGNCQPEAAISERGKHLRRGGNCRMWSLVTIVRLGYGAWGPLRLCCDTTGIIAEKMPLLAFFELIV
jgi:hypothetical protein